MTISTKRGTLDLTKHIDPQFIEQILAMGSWLLDADGYIRHVCKATRKHLRLHRVIYEFQHGPISVDIQIDHIDGNRANNFLSNLRLVTSHHNQWNRRTAKGYSWYKRDKKWQAVICVNNQGKHLGYFDTEAEARQAYLDAKAIYHVIP